MEKTVTAELENDPKITFFTGKGGVGKSSVAYAYAMSKRKKGKKVLLVELGHQSHFQNYLAKYRPELGHAVSSDPLEILEGLFVALWPGEFCLREYLTHLIRFPKLVDLFFSHRVTKALVKAAPALKELSILGKLTSGIRNFGPPMDFDHIVVDAFSTGHFLALLRVPISLAELIKRGPMGQQCNDIDRVLKDASLCQYFIVTLPEELPTTEACEMYLNLRKEFNLSPRIILNKWIDAEFKDNDLQLWGENFQGAGDMEFPKDFLSQMRDLRGCEEKSLASFRELGETPLKLSMIFDSQISNIYEELAARMERQWKN